MLVLHRLIVYVFVDKLGIKYLPAEYTLSLV